MTIRFSTSTWILLAIVALAPLAHAGALEEVVITGSYRTQEDIPGSYLQRCGDCLLLHVNVTNDTREIYETLKNALAASTKRPGVELSVIDQQDNVIPLNRENYEVDLGKGDRPDTSATSIRVKKKIPASVNDADQLVSDLAKFVNQIAVVGRTKLVADGSVDISIVDPNQYRAHVIKRCT